MNIASLVPPKNNVKIPPLAPGDTVRVHTRIVEAGKERIQVFQGIVIRIKRGSGASFTVRHVAYGIGVERTFPYQSPRVESVEIVRHGKVRRARLYYLRERSGKAARLKERRVDREKLGLEAEAEEVAEEAEAIPEELTEEVKEETPAQTVAEAKGEAPEQPAAETVEPAKAALPPQTEEQPPKEEKKE